MLTTYTQPHGLMAPLGEGALRSTTRGSSSAAVFSVLLLGFLGVMRATTMSEGALGLLGSGGWGTPSATVENEKEEALFPAFSFTRPECSSRGMHLLTSALAARPEQDGLRTIVLREDPDGDRDAGWDGPPLLTFPGLTDDLWEQSFRGLRIALLGDSTLRNLYRWIHVLRTEASHGVRSRLSGMDLADANGVLNPTGDKNPSKDRLLGGVGYTTRSVLDGGHTMVKYVYAAEKRCSLTERYEELEAEGPFDVVIANMGMHWLHFVGRGRPAGLCVAKKWIHFEREWLEETAKQAEALGARLLMFKTINPIVSERFVGRYRRADRLYARGDKNVLDECYRILRGGDPEQVLVESDGDLRSYCANGTFNERGVSRLNDRMRRFVEERGGGNGDSGMRIVVFNDHDVLTMNYTERADGRHYHPLNLMRIRLLGNYLRCLR